MVTAAVPISVLIEAPGLGFGSLISARAAPKAPSETRNARAATFFMRPPGWTAGSYPTRLDVSFEPPTLAGIKTTTHAPQARLSPPSSLHRLPVGDCALHRPPGIGAPPLLGSPHREEPRGHPDGVRGGDRPARGCLRRREPARNCRAGRCRGRDRR